jgi:hypothetical protein
MAFGADQGWQEAVINYAEQYAGKTKEYYQQFLRDYKNGSYGG